MRGWSVSFTLAALVALSGSGCKKGEQPETQDSELARQGGTEIVLDTHADEPDKIHAMLARQGGTEIVLETDADKRDKIYAMLLKRVEASPSPEAILEKEGTSRIVVQIPGTTDIKRYERLMTTRAFIAWMLVAEDYVALDESNTWSTARLLEIYDRAVRELPDRGPDPSKPDDAEATVPYKDDEGTLVNFEAFDKKLKDEDHIPADTILRIYEDVDRLGNTVRTPLLLRSSENQPHVLSGRDLTLDNCTVVRGPHDEPWIKFEIKDPEASRRFEDVTDRYSSASDNGIPVAHGHRGWRLAILLDNKVISAPSIRTRIADGRGVIHTGTGTFEEANLLALQLRSGSLPTPVRVVAVRVIPPASEAE